MTQDREGVRLDRWLWAARFYKTRSQATAAVKAGKVEVGEQRAKPSQTIRRGSVVVVRKDVYHFTVRVLDLAERRGTAELARSLFQEDPKSIEKREQIRARLFAEKAILGSRVGPRPTKRERRAFESFRDQFYFAEDFDD